MKWAVIGTWDMAYEGCRIAADILKKENGASDKAVIRAVKAVEDNEMFHSVGYGGWPDETGTTVLDGGFMDGNTLHFGAVGSLTGFASPVEIAYSLKNAASNNFLVGEGARLYAAAHGFKERNNLTPEAFKRYENRINENEEPKAYDGHDTVCFIALDQKGSICAAVSTSGLFLKKRGRVGDSPLPGNGYYCDSSIGGACATGMGEEIMKGALSYAIVRSLEEGSSAMDAAFKEVYKLSAKLKKKNGYAREMSAVCLDKKGNFGIGTNCPFTFVYASDEMAPRIFRVTLAKGGLSICQLSPKEAAERRRKLNKKLIEGEDV